MNIVQNKDEFINIMVSFEKDIENYIKQTSNSKIEGFKSQEHRISMDRFKNYFAKQTAVHIICKYILIRMTEDRGALKSKLNEEGIEKWREMSKNIKNDYVSLFQIACDDIRRDKASGNVFNENIYDGYIGNIKSYISPTIEDQNKGYFEKLKKYDFRTINPGILMAIIEEIYPAEDRKNTKNFLEQSLVINQVMNMLGLA